MAVSETFRSFVLDQLGQVVPHVSSRAMFGGLGIYSDNVFFALIAYETLFLKVDDSNRPALESLGSQPFRPFEHGPVMSYYDCPLAVLESVPRLREFANDSLAVAKAARKPKKKAVKKRPITQVKSKNAAKKKRK